MDSFELNKILGALLGTVFILFSVNLASNTIFASPAPEKPGYAIAAAEPAEGGGATEAPAGVESVLPLLASADVAAGQVTFKKCQTCHDGTKGGPNKTGPNLWGVVERPIATHEGFSYSAGMKEFSKGGTEKWTFEHLDGFLHAPKNYVKGTAMGFAGLKKTDERANLIAFLHTLSDSPVPLPAAGSADKAAQTGDGVAAPAAGDAAAPAAATPATGGNAAAPAKDATAPATPTPADNGNSAAPAPTTAPAAGGDAATPAAPATGDAATPAKGADGGPATEANKPAAPANGAASEPATPPPATATPEPDAAPKN